MAALPPGDRPGAMLNASGIHFYGDRGDDEISEQSPPGRGFFAEMCQAWEAAAAPAEDAGVRVVRLRTGLTIDRDSAFMKPFLLQFRLFVGGRLGTGRQWMPWVSMRDWLDATVLLLGSDIAGRVLARLLHRPALFPVPMFALKIAIGEFAEEALASLRARPDVLTAAGFSYADADVESALAWALGRT
jgi:NAD dependent epimerase/dehydratase family enzyme